jgi:hypothetical protein
MESPKMLCYFFKTELDCSTRKRCRKGKDFLKLFKGKKVKLEGKPIYLTNQSAFYRESAFYKIALTLFT